MRSGRIEFDEPIDLPDGTELLIPMPKGAPESTDDDGPMSANEIARVLAALDQIVPFERSADDEVRLEADRLARKEGKGSLQRTRRQTPRDVEMKRFLLDSGIH